MIVDDAGNAVAGEIWWKPDCSARIDPDKRAHQPHYQVIEKQDQAQIYQKLAASPADADKSQCGTGAKPDAPLTSSFLSICAKVKDNRILPHGFPGLDQRMETATALGAKHDLAEEVAPVGTGDDPHYSGTGKSGGEDKILYRIASRTSTGSLPRSGQLFTIRRFRPFSCRIASVLLRARIRNGSTIWLESSIPRPDRSKIEN